MNQKVVVALSTIAIVLAVITLTLLLIPNLPIDISNILNSNQKSARAYNDTKQIRLL